MKNNLLNNLKIIFILIEIDFINFKSQFFNKIIDNIIVVMANVIILGYVLREFGLVNFGLFAHTGLLASLAFWELYPFISEIIYDFDHGKKISYELILPIPSYLIFIKKILSSSIKYSLLTICFLPIGKLFLWNEFFFTKIMLLKLIFFIFLENLFCFSFGLFAASVIKTASKMESLWSRFLFPVWIFGGYQFNWKALNAVFPIFSYVSLINPMLYVTEGIRNILINSTDFISLPICIFSLILFVIFFSFFGIYKLKRYLDFV